MKQHIILSAFGTTTLAQTTYSHLDSLIKSRFPKCRTHWCFSSPTVHKKPLKDLLMELGKNENSGIIIQSVHVTPGQEFHQLVREAHSSSIQAAIGMPLLTSPEDHQRVVHALLPLIDNDSQTAVLILGHGTDHPSWTVLPAFEKIIRKIAGKHVFVAALEKYPFSDNIINEIASEGFSRVLVIPLLITAGMHFKRDIIGNSPQSWKSRLEKSNIEFFLHEKGLGMLEGISDIINDHIQQAMISLTK